MAELLIDLSVPMERNDGEIAEFGFRQIGHREGGDVFGRNFALSRKPTLKATLLSAFRYFTGKQRISRKSFPQEEFLNLEIVTASTHTGTHFDAPLHFGSTSEGLQAPPVDHIPLEWCYGDGVVLDLTHKKAGEFILPEDLGEALDKIGYSLKPGDIVLLRTGADRHWGTKEYLTCYPGMSREATAYLTGKGIRLIGVDSYGLDRPFANMMGDYLRTKDNRVLFPAHFWGRDKLYCHMERLTNLDKLPAPFGFKIACFPVKLRGAGAAWVRAVAIVPQETTVR